MKVEKSIKINSSISRVWDVLTDFKNYPVWMRSNEKIESLSSKEIGKGFTFYLHGIVKGTRYKTYNRVVEWKEDEEFEQRYPAAYSCAVTVTMENGQEFTSVVDNPKGDHRNPMTQEEINQKFTALARIEIPDEGKISDIIAFINELEKADDINALFSVFEM